MRNDRRRLVAIAVAALIAPCAQASQTGPASGKTWSNVMYLGGVADVRGKSLDWESKLTISKEKIIFAGKNKITFEIDTNSVRRLDYKGHRHVNDSAAGTGFMYGGLLGALVGSSARSTDHYLEITYTLTDGTIGGFLLRLHKENQQEIIDAMHAATGIEK